MTGAEVFALISALQAAIAAAPKAIQLVEDTKNYITSLFKAGLITKEQQDAAHAYADAQAALFSAGIIPDSLKVDPDPGTV